MSAAERDAFEAELVRSPARRDDLIAAVDMDRADVGTARDAAGRCDRARDRTRDGSAPSAPAKHSAGFAGWIEWLLPRPRLAIATSALAMFAIVAVGIDIALHTNPQFRQVIQSQSTPAGGSDAPRGRIRSRLPPSNAQPERPLLPPAPQLGDPILFTAETINALIAYRDDPSAARRQELLAALVRAGARRNSGRSCAIDCDTAAIGRAAHPAARRPADANLGPAVDRTASWRSPSPSSARGTSECQC